MLTTITQSRLLKGWHGILIGNTRRKSFLSRPKMNRKLQILDQIKMYAVLIGQQEDMLETITHLRKYSSETTFDQQEAEVNRMIAENSEKIKKFQEELEKLEE